MSNKPNGYSTGPLELKYDAERKCLDGDPEIYHKKIGIAPPDLKFEIKCIGDTLDGDLVLSLSEKGVQRAFSNFFGNVAATITLTKYDPSMQLEFNTDLKVEDAIPLKVGGIGLELRLHHNIPSCGHTDDDSLRMNHVDLHVEC